METVGHRPAARGSAETILSYFAESRGEVDALLAKVKSIGATVSPAEDDEEVSLEAILEDLKRREGRSG